MVKLMSWSLLARKVVCCCSLAALAPVAFAQLSYVPQAGQYALTEPLIGDQMFPQLALGTNNSYLVWEDNRTDASGSGISVLALDANFSGILAPMPVNQQTAGNQSSPQVSLLSGGGAGFVWLSGPAANRQVCARFLNAAKVFTTGDVQVSANTNRTKLSPMIAGLTGGNAVVLWTSFDQAGANSLQDVYGQVLSGVGQKVGTEFRLNQFTKYNQRTPAVAALPSGGFVAAWISEQQQREVSDNPNTAFEYVPGENPSIDVYARIYTAAGAAVGNEFLINSSTNMCANPSVAVAADGTFMVAWSQKDVRNRTNGWDVYARSFSATGAAAGAGFRVNTFVYGDQFAPKIRAAGSDYLIIWTSLQQDGSREGVFGQFVRGNGLLMGNELLVNTQTLNQQLHPAVGSDGSRFLVVWTSFMGIGSSFDLFGQRYVNTDLPIYPMNPPFVEVPFTVVGGSYKPEVRVSWPAQTGLPVDHYEVYLNGNASPVTSLTTNYWVMPNATANTTYSLQVAFVTTDQRKSPLSAVTEAKTWGGLNWGGVPFEWMTAYYGNDISTWPPAGGRLAADGPTLLHAFLTGADPGNPQTWLRTKLVRKPGGALLTWNPQPGLIYQAQISTDLRNWVNLGGPRFAADYSDSVLVGGNALSYYRVLRLR